MGQPLRPQLLDRRRRRVSAAARGAHGAHDDRDPDYEVHKLLTLDATRAALVIIDMQNDFVRDDGTLQVASAPSTVPAISRLLELARSSGMRVVFSQDTHDPRDPELEIWPAHALRGT